MELPRKGAENGKDNRPVQASQAPDDVEQAVIEHIENERHESYQILEDNFHRFATRLRNLDFNAHFGLIRQANISSLTDFKAEVASGRDELFGLRKSLKEADEELADFREANELKRVARIKSPISTAVKWLVIAAVLIIETVVNGIYLSEGNEQGLIGGIGVAFGFAFVNVAATVVLALYVIPNVVHRRRGWNLVGYLGVCGWLFVAVGLNFVMAHYREASGDTFTQVGALVMGRLRNAPFTMDDMDSWILFATGLVFSTVALVEALLIRDPYPGYAGVYFRYATARKSYVDHKNHLIETLQGIRDDHNLKLETVIRDLVKRRREAAAIIDSRTRIANLFTEHQNHLESAARKLLTMYREANRETRTEPEPIHFSSQYMMERRKAVPNTGEDWSDQDLAEGIKSAQADIQEQMRQIGQEFAMAVDAYHQLDTLFPETINGKAQA
ncbi:hypothetical protein [Sinorhizobium fredii]|nr:hypothetical protein [Sinorhizobium fredii]